MLALTFFSFLSESCFGFFNVQCCFHKHLHKAALRFKRRLPLPRLMDSEGNQVPPELRDTFNWLDDPVRQLDISLIEAALSDSINEVDSVCQALRSELSYFCRRVEESAAVLEAFKARLDQELVEALASLHQRIDRLCFQRADLWAQFLSSQSSL